MNALYKVKDTDTGHYNLGLALGCLPYLAHARRRSGIGEALPCPRNKIMSYLPSNNSFTSRDDFSPSARRALSILFDRSCAILSSLLIAQPMLGWLESRRNNKCRAPTDAARPTNKNKLHHTPITNSMCVAFIVSR